MIEEYENWNLEEIVNFLINENSSIQKIYLFGSRGYDTGSLRSDIDILVISEKAIGDLPLRDNIHHVYPPLDLFISTDNKTARSLANGSVLNLRSNYTDIVEQIEGKLLWDKQNNFNENISRYRIQKTKKNIDFRMTIIPNPDNSLHDDLNKCLNKITNTGFRPFFSGKNVLEISQTIINMIKDTFVKPNLFAKKAHSFSFDLLKINREYDFQNLIQLILRPVFPSIQPEPVQIKIDNNNKIADFSIYDNKIIIEAKYIYDTSSKNSVLKTINGLADFYSTNSNVKSIIFLVLYNPDVQLDRVQLEGKFSNYSSNNLPIYISFIENIYK